MKDELNPLLSADFDNGSVLTYPRSAISYDSHVQLQTQNFNTMTSVRSLLILGLTVFIVLLTSWPAEAAGVDPYVKRFLDAVQPAEIKLDEQGNTKAFSGLELSQGKKLFDESCKNCHVGGATLPNPPVSLALSALKGAMPPRDNINNLVAYMRSPLTYDGSEESFVCRQVKESWMSQSEAETVAAFLLRAAEKAPAWGTAEF
jgi:photosystem II cytochrome c550